MKRYADKRTALVCEMMLSRERKARYMQGFHYRSFSKYTGLTEKAKPSELVLNGLDRVGLRKATVFRIKAWGERREA